MPKALSLGNGHALVLVDRSARVRDIYFPYVGLENHVGGRYAHRVGVWGDGRMSWMDDGTWSIDVRLDAGSVGRTKAVHQGLGLTITIEDALYNEQNIFLRKFEIENGQDRERSVKVFFNQQFEIYHSESGDTAFYDPATNAIIHYEGRRAFLVNARASDHGFDDFSVGIFQIEGKEGTFRDAEDGVLEKNPIEHGRVDSTIGITLSLPPKGSGVFYFWLTLGHSVEEVKQLNATVLLRSPQYLIDSTRNYWSAWVGRNHWDLYGLGEGVAALFERSQFTLRSHVDHNGAIIASGDSDMLQGGRDTYAYVWPRDAAYAAVALDWTGDHHAARKFFEFCNKVITEDGYLMHKYRSDTSLGSSWHGWLVHGHPELPIQEDETALILWALWEHWESSKDLEFIESIYNSFIKKAAAFLVSYRDADTGLPKLSYNLWEERFAVHTYTAATVYAGLRAAEAFAEILGKERSEHNYGHAAEELRDAILRHLYDPATGTFFRSVAPDAEKQMTVYDTTIDASSAYGIFQFGVLPPDDARLVRAMEVARERLTVRTPVGGIARYENDRYYRMVERVPGNPWIITTLWFLQFDIARASDDASLDLVRTGLNWVERNALPSGILPEQLDPHTREHISASPLAWSHAEYVRTVILYLRRLVDLGIRPAQQINS